MMSEYEGQELIPTVVENKSRRIDHVFLRWLGRKIRSTRLQKIGVTRFNLYEAIMKLRDEARIKRNT